MFIMFLSTWSERESSGSQLFCLSVLLLFLPQVGDMVSMVSAPTTRQGPPPPVKPSQSIIQAAPTVYSAPPVGHRRIDIRAQRQARMVRVMMSRGWRRGGVEGGE